MYLLILTVKEGDKHMFKNTVVGDFVFITLGVSTLLAIVFIIQKVIDADDILIPACFIFKYIR